VAVSAECFWGDFRLYLVIRKFKPIFRRMVPWLFPGSLKAVELRDAFLQIAVDALLVDAEERELFGIGKEDARAVESRVDLNIFSGGGGFEIAEREDVGLDGEDAIETPVVVGDRLSDLELEGVCGLEAVQELGAELVVGRAVFGGEDGGLPGEAVAEVVQADALAARGGRGAGGMESVAAVGFELFFRDHGCSCVGSRLKE
jgi:hypothetical protein